jgi:hypothetical protein
MRKDEAVGNKKKMQVCLPATTLRQEVPPPNYQLLSFVIPFVLQKTIFLRLKSVKKLKISRICLPLERLKEGKQT